jgi:hypothetical protein
MISIKISLSVVVYFLLEGSFEKAVFYFYGKSKLKGSLLSDTHTIGSNEKNISEQKKITKKTFEQIISRWKDETTNKCHFYPMRVHH